ncbi:type 1 glutamine amidotransferase domain-containing protein [Streptomyces sp. NPDC006632]|uniref:type 1 glutamine amidotransferase domain-containing protein n=1 Tax=unclassified Streptomyces TaxID=2593676 RepID=UPI002E22DA8E
MADHTPAGRRVLAMVTNYGVEQDELIVPVEHLRAAGAEVDVAAVTTDPVQTLVGDKDPGRTVPVTLALSDVDPASYDLLLIPGGTVNADSLRLQPKAVETVRAFASTGRPVAAICHGPWLVVEAGVAEGKTLTSYASVATDIRNAGGTWVDKPVFNCGANGWPLITSRTPDDLKQFLAETDAVLAGVAS